MKRTILLALVSAAFGVVNAQITIPDGTKVRVRASQLISSATAEPGQEVQFEVAEAIEVDNTVMSLSPVPDGVSFVRPEVANFVLGSDLPSTQPVQFSLGISPYVFSVNSYVGSAGWGANRVQ